MGAISCWFGCFCGFVHLLPSIWLCLSSFAVYGVDVGYGFWFMLACAVCVVVVGGFVWFLNVALVSVLVFVVVWFRGQGCAFCW